MKNVTTKTENKILNDTCAWTPNSIFNFKSQPAAGGEHFFVIGQATLGYSRLLAAPSDLALLGYSRLLAAPSDFALLGYSRLL